jgi:hypothetical protein
MLLVCFFQLEVLQRYCKKVAPLFINGAILLKMSLEANVLGNCATGNSMISGTGSAPQRVAIPSDIL